MGRSTTARLETLDRATAMPTARRVTRARQTGRLLMAFALPCFVLTCGGPAEPTDNERETFVATYVELRRAAITASEELTDSERAAILEGHGATEEGLIAFVETYGENLDAMRAVWDEVENRLGRIADADSGTDGGTGTNRGRE